MRKIIVFILMEYPVQSKTQTKKTAFGLQVINSILLKRIVIDDLQLTNTKLAANTHIMKRKELPMLSMSLSDCQSLQG